VYAAIVRLIALGSIVACAIVIASFTLFAVNQTGQASTHQQQLLSGEISSEAGAQAPPVKSHESSVRRTIDEASEWLTSPFNALTSGASSAWATHGIDLALALVVYGFGLGFIARTLRVRV
jgi:predicted PurR-regulated permease PerM